MAERPSSTANKNAVQNDQEADPKGQPTAVPSNVHACQNDWGKGEEAVLFRWGDGTLVVLPLSKAEELRGVGAIVKPDTPKYDLLKNAAIGTGPNGEKVAQKYGKFYVSDAGNNMIELEV